MEINRSNVMEIVNNAGLKPDKDYGQNFLVEPEVCKRIVDSAIIEENDSVLEIGPGLGSLTHFISETKAKITIVDIDRRMIDFLLIFYKNNLNFDVIENDIRKTDVSHYSKIIGNLPYNITTETVIYLLKNASKAKKMVLMIQTEAFNRFHNLEGKDYGPASILIHLLGDSKRLFNVKAGSFYPVPKCGSTVFEINLDGTKDREEAIRVYELSKNLFLNRRKTIMNNLVNYTHDKAISENILTACNISSTKRPEELSPEDFKNIYLELTKVK